jgi:hypothetical protein
LFPCVKKVWKANKYGSQREDKIDTLQPCTLNLISKRIEATVLRFMLI